MSAILSSPPAASELLSDQVWRGDELAGRTERTLATGLAALDEVLPGGGWPVGQLVEILQSRPQQHVWRLLLPALARAVRAQEGPVLLVGPPHPVFVPSLAAQGLPGHRLIWVKAGPAAARLWAAEQALRCAEVTAVLAWLPQAEAAELRRLHLAAQQHQRLLFVFRPESARVQHSPARLRLLLESGEALRVHVLKRRGPPLVTPVLLPAMHEMLGQWLRSRAAVESSPSPLEGEGRVRGLARRRPHPDPLPQAGEGEIQGHALARPAHSA